MGCMTTLTTGQVAADVDARHWTVQDGTLVASVATSDFAHGLELVTLVGDLAETANHHPDIDLRYSSVRLRLVSHDAGALTRRDVQLAQRISELLDDMDLDTTERPAQTVQLAIDARDAARIRPFWAAVLGYEERRRGDAIDLVDPSGVGPTLWFQPMDEPRTQRNRLHLDVWVPASRADERVSAALAAGGHLETSEHAPSWWVLADAEGNEACVCTWQDDGADEV